MNHEGHEDARNARNEEERRREIRELVIEGCREMADVMLEIEREFEASDAEVLRKHIDGE